MDEQPGRQGPSRSAPVATEAIKAHGVRLKPEAIAAAVAIGRISATRAEELLADDGFPANPVVGLHLYPTPLPEDGRTAPVTVALVSRINGPDRAIMVRRDSQGWLVFTEDDGPVGATGPGVDGWQQAVATARAHAFYVASSWLV